LYDESTVFNQSPMLHEVVQKCLELSICKIGVDTGSKEKGYDISKGEIHCSCLNAILPVDTAGNLMGDAAKAN